ncbi:hypothetical protein [Dactylosporangium salmoneum]|uniref:Uncharacterized protein n=1 Tax=Dactylosporangium salmoneum TaxID=53361 RepID=A0ABN3GIZ1_9ACTN
MQLGSGPLRVRFPGYTFIAHDEPWARQVYDQMGDAGAHGSPAQRTSSFFAGYDSGLNACDLPTRTATSPYPHP